jgi:HlyD family secretion protein
VKVTFLGDAPTTPAAGRVLVLKAAIRDEGGKPTVFVVRDGRAERRAVKQGNARGSETEVLAGLADGEQIVVSGVKDLRDGQRVAVKR